MSRPVVAAFDLDGTLTRRDTLLPFLARLRGRHRLAAALGAHGWSLARMAAGREDRDALKDRFLLGLLRGLPAGEVAAAGATYADRLAVAGRFRPAVLDRFRAHGEAGHRVLVVSASPEVYVGPLARLLGAEDALATRLAAAADGRLTGLLDGANCRGDEKVRRLDAWLAEAGLGDARVVAYGDSASDAPLLARAHRGVLVRGARPLPATPAADAW
jgi:phosphatidylglycerophosphatase C